MFKSKLFEDTDILCKKPDIFKRACKKYNGFYADIFKLIINVPLENIDEYFLNNNKTLISCRLSAGMFKEAESYNYFVEEYFYSSCEKELTFSHSYDLMLNRLREPIKSEDIELTFVRDELILNILVCNSVLKK